MTFCVFPQRNTSPINDVCSVLLIQIRFFFISRRQTRFVLPGSAGSPPKILTFDEVRDAIKNVEDMQLAHEIAINPNFRLQPYDPPESSLEKRIKAIMHDAFWDHLREQLNSDPPCYDHAIALLSDIKEVSKFVHIVFALF